jgi:branched-chain amino acid transport system ATP-binding protein
MAWCEGPIASTPAANKLPMVTNSLNSNSLNRKSLQLSVLQDATELTMEDRAAALARIEASIAPLAIADLAYVLETGRMTMSGTAAAIKNDQRVREAYLGV